MNLADIRTLLPTGYYVIHAGKHSVHLTDNGGKMVYQTFKVDAPNGSYKVQHWLNEALFTPDSMLYAEVDASYNGLTLLIKKESLTIFDNDDKVVFSTRPKHLQ